MTDVYKEDQHWCSVIEFPRVVPCGSVLHVVGILPDAEGGPTLPETHHMAHCKMVQANIEAHRGYLKLASFLSGDPFHY